MKTILATFLTVLLLLPVSAFGEIQTITHTIKQPFGGSQSPDDARISAVAKAKREALELAGTYIESLTVVKNSQVDKDEILALAAGVLKTDVLSQENYHTKDAFGIEVVVKVVVDTSVLESRVKKLLQDRTHLEQLNQTRKKEKELLNEVARLGEENQRLMAKKQSSGKLKKQFQNISQELTVVDWKDKSIVLWDGGKYTEPQKAIEYLNQAIRLKPDDADVYSRRGDVYFSMRIFERTIEDYSRAILLRPADYSYYLLRGGVYGILGQSKKAIQDFDQAILLKPDFADAYFLRGIEYTGQDQHYLAIKDFDQAILLKPDFAKAYNVRGLTYLISGNTLKGCSSLIRACELGDCKNYHSNKSKGLCR